MNILTISASPYLNSRNGRINRDLILSLSQAGHKIDGAVWHHDIMYFLPSENKKHIFTHNNKRICELYPFLGNTGELAKFAYQTMKVVQPQIVITVGSYEEISCISSIKSLYPHLFKWIAIFPCDINERYKESMDYADCVISTNLASFVKTKSLLQTDVVYVPYGPDAETFKPYENKEYGDFSVLNCGKNSQMSNIPAFMKALSITRQNGTIHTNMHDQGDYDVMLLMDRYNLYETLMLPQKFVSIREGITQNSMNELYNRHQAIVECSMQSPTALGMLEAMATGCIPVGTLHGAVGDVLKNMADENRFVVPHEVFIGPREEEYAIISATELAAALKKLESRFKGDKEWFESARNDAISVAKLFSRDIFISRVNHMIQDIATSQHAIVVDSFG